TEFYAALAMSLSCIEDRRRRRPIRHRLVADNAAKFACKLRRGLPWIHGIDPRQGSYPAADIVARRTPIGGRHEAHLRRTRGGFGCLGIAAIRLIKVFEIALEKPRRRVRFAWQPAPCRSGAGIYKLS